TQLFRRQHKAPPPFLPPLRSPTPSAPVHARRQSRLHNRKGGTGVRLVVQSGSLFPEQFAASPDSKDSNALSTGRKHPGFARCRASPDGRVSNHGRDAPVLAGRRSGRVSLRRRAFESSLPREKCESRRTHEGTEPCFEEWPPVRLAQSPLPPALSCQIAWPNRWCV